MGIVAFNASGAVLRDPIPASSVNVSDLDFDVATQAELNAHAATPHGGAATAADVAFTPTGSIAATDVQAALAEIASEYAAAVAALAARHVAIYKTSDQTVNNSVALTDVTDLSFAIGANETWVGRLLLLHNSSTVADLRANIAAPVGATGGVNWLRQATTATSASNTPTNSRVAVGTYLAIGGIGVDFFAACDFRVTNGVTAGTMKVQFSQDNLEVSDTKILTGSFIVAHKVV